MVYYLESGRSFFLSSLFFGPLRIVVLFFPFLEYLCTSEGVDVGKCEEPSWNLEAMNLSSCCTNAG